MTTALSAIVVIGAAREQIGEFAIHSAAMIAGAVMAFDIGCRLSRSLPASVVPLALLSVTPTFHYPKLLFYPLAIRLTWWYTDCPTIGRGVAMGGLIATAFLFRHDHGLYIGGLVAATMLVTRLAVRNTRNLAALGREVTAGLAIGSIAVGVATATVLKADRPLWLARFSVRQVEAPAATSGRQDVPLPGGKTRR